MSNNYAEVLQAVLSLSDDERRRLLEELFDSLPEHQCPPGIWSIHDPGFLDEIERRANDGERGISLSEIREELRKDVLEGGPSGG